MDQRQEPCAGLIAESTVYPTDIELHNHVQVVKGLKQLAQFKTILRFGKSLFCDLAT